MIDPHPVSKLRPWPFRLFAIAAASLFAGLLIALEFVAFVLVANNVEPAPLGGLVSFTIYAGVIGAAGFGAGLVFLGTPPWLLLHGIGKRDYFTAALAGGALGSGVGFFSGAFAGWMAGLYMIAWVVLPGITAGLVIRRIAYEPQPKPPPARPS